MELARIPGYTRAFERARRIEDSLREFAFLDVHEEIAGVPVRQLTLRLLLRLYFAKSPFVCGGLVDESHIAVFLWAVSPHYSADLASRKAFLAAIGHLKLQQTRRAIRRYLDRAFLDQPAKSRGATKEPVTSFVASLIHTFAKAYGWDDEALLDKPLARLFQMLRRIEIDENPKVIHFNPIAGRVNKAFARRARKGASK